MEKVTRFSGADWASEIKDIMIIGQGGIGSWLSLNLSRIGHNLYLVDDDIVDETNVTGGQMFRNMDIGRNKTNAVRLICRDFGCENLIETFSTKFNDGMGNTDIMITCLDNMAARRQAFECWEQYVNSSTSRGDKAKCLFIDGRLTMEMWEIFAMDGNSEKVMGMFKEKHLFSDEEAIALDCSTKQSTFAAMSIAASITSIVCNFLTNAKLKDEGIRTVPFYQRMYFPINLYEATFQYEEPINNNTKIAIVNE